MSAESSHQKPVYEDKEKGHVADDVTSVRHDPNGAYANEPHQGELQRQLKNRHIAMISIGGVIGTGLFIGTANALRHGGPVGLCLGYAMMGSVVWSVMIALGEMVAHLPIQGGHLTLAHRFVDSSWSFTMGWNYWYNWTIVLPAEISASAVLVGFWTSKVDNSVWITVFLIIVWAINLGGARIYGELEFWFASIKVITIIGLIILGIILDCGGGPDGDAIGFRYWRNPGPFVQYEGVPGVTGRFLGFFSVLVTAAFSYIGTEITAIAAGEAKNPKRNLPKAIRSVVFRIMVFYILGTFIISLLVPWNDPRLSLDSSTGAKSPFVIAIKNAGIKGLPSVVNAAFLTAAWSAASSDLYVSSRALYGMALSGNAPSVFRKTTSWGLPIYAYFVGILFSLLSYMAADAGEAGKVFGYFANMTSVAGLLTWCGIFVTYLRFRAGIKAQGIDRRATLPFVAPLQPYASWYGLIFCSTVIFFNGFGVFLKGHWDTATFVTSYFPVLFSFVLYIGHKVTKREPNRKPEDMDFFTGSKDVEEEDEAPPRNFVEKVWRVVM